MNYISTRTANSEKQTASYVIKTLAAYDIKVSQDVADYMVASCTSDKLLLINILLIYEVKIHIPLGIEVAREITKKILLITPPKKK